MKTLRMKVANPPKPRPVMTYNGEVSFSRRVAFFLRGVTRKQVDFADYNRAYPRFPEVDLAHFKEEMKLITPAGYVYGGAEAVFKAFTYGGIWGWLWSLYEALPPFRWISEMIYRHIEKKSDAYSRKVGPFWIDWDSGGSAYEVLKPRTEAPTPVRRDSVFK